MTEDIVAFRQSCERDFDRSLDRLVKFRKLTPTSWRLISYEVVLLVKALTIHPLANFWESWQASIQGYVRNGRGWCTGCDRPHRSEGLCDDCAVRIVSSLTSDEGDKS
jgi:hypothetical protein